MAALRIIYGHTPFILNNSLTQQKVVSLERGLLLFGFFWGDGGVLPVLRNSHRRVGWQGRGTKSYNSFKIVAKGSYRVYQQPHGVGVGKLEVVMGFGRARNVCSQLFLAPFTLT